MRAINTGAMVTFTLVTAATTVAGVVVGWQGIGRLPLGDFRGIAVVFSAALSIFLLTVLAYRVLFSIWPLIEGDLAPGSVGESRWNLNALFGLMVFAPLADTQALPLPLKRLLFVALGARMGANSHCAGKMLDPMLTSMGRDCVIGQDAIVFAHAIERDRLALARVTMGDRVTIGAQAVVMSGVTLGDDATVAVGAVVLTGQTIGAGETWGGVPARRLDK